MVVVVVVMGCLLQELGFNANVHPVIDSAPDPARTTRAPWRAAHSGWLSAMVVVLGRNFNMSICHKLEHC